MATIAQLLQIKKKNYTVTTTSNGNVAPFGYAAGIAYDSDVTRDNFVSAYYDLTAVGVIMPFPDNILVACNFARTFNVTVLYKVGG